MLGVRDTNGDDLAAGAWPEPIPQECTIILGIIHACAHGSGSTRQSG